MLYNIIDRVNCFFSIQHYALNLSLDGSINTGLVISTSIVLFGMGENIIDPFFFNPSLTKANAIDRPKLGD